MIDFSSERSSGAPRRNTGGERKTPAQHDWPTVDVETYSEAFAVDVRKHRLAVLGALAEGVHLRLTHGRLTLAELAALAIDLEEMLTFLVGSGRTA